MENRPSYFIPDRPPLQREIRSAVDEAIYDVLGGPSAAAEALESSRGAVGNLVANQPIKDRATAIKIEEATAKAKRKIPAAELMALVPWGSLREHGLTSAPPPGGRKRKDPNGSSPRLVTTGKPAGGGIGEGQRTAIGSATQAPAGTLQQKAKKKADAKRSPSSRSSIPTQGGLRKAA